MFDSFSPAIDISIGVSLTFFGSSVETFMEMPFDGYVDDVVAGRMQIPIKVYKFEHQHLLVKYISLQRARSSRMASEFCTRKPH